MSVSQRIIHIGCIALLSLSGALGQTLLEYLKLRKQYGITQAVGVQALETLVGTRVFEVKGIIKGTFEMDGQVCLMVERTGGESLVIDAKSVPEWVYGNEVPARLLVRATREREYSELDADLIGIASEHSIASLQAPAPPPKKKIVVRPKGVQVSRHKSWNLPASEVMPIYSAFIQKRNKRLTQAEADRIAQSVIGFSLKYGVDARLIMAMVMVESGFNPAATSRTGAMGLGQLMPGTAAGMGVSNAYDSVDNLYGTVRLVRGHLAKYKKQTGDDFQSLVLALAAYNAGSGAVKKHGGVPPYRETQNYVVKVINLYRQFAYGK